MDSDHIILKLLRKYKPEFEVKTVSKNGIVELIMDYGDAEPLNIPLDDSVKWASLKKIVDAIVMIRGGVDQTKLNSPEDTTSKI